MSQVITVKAGARQCLWRFNGKPTGDRCRAEFQATTPLQACCVYHGINWKRLSTPQRHALRAAAAREDATIAA